MKNKLSYIFSCLILGATLSGCVKDEMPNIEVDITGVSSQADDILNVSININAEIIDIYAAPGTDLADMRLTYALSEGAKITPDPAEVTDYTAPRQFTVISEDSKWHKTYTVTVRFSNLPTTYGFDNWKQPERARYKIPYETRDGYGTPAELNIWACGNDAYSFLTNKNDDFTAFPTQPTTESYAGAAAAKLVTRLTGQIDRPIAAGNLFIGVFDSSMREPKESTQFGLPFMSRPERFKGKFKYRSGGLTLASQQPDHCKIQAVLYRTDNGVEHLNGFTIKNSPAIVARAELDEAAAVDTPGESFASFDIPFVYTADIDPTLLRAGGYNLAVIFSSSRDGDVYDGAPESTLVVDEVEITLYD